MTARTAYTPPEVTDEFIDEAVAGLKANSEYAWMASSPTMVQVWVSGCWLEHKLRELGAPQKEIERVGFTFGQMCVGREPWALLERIIDAWHVDQVPDPGPELADELIDASPDGQLGPILTVAIELAEASEG